MRAGAISVPAGGRLALVSVRRAGVKNGNNNIKTRRTGDKVAGLDV